MNKLKFIPRDTRDFSAESIAERRHNRTKGKSLKNILLDRFLNHYGYDKGIVTANAIIDDLLLLIEQYYRYSDNSFLKEGQMVSNLLFLLMNFQPRVNLWPRLKLNLLSWTLSLRVTLMI